MESHEITPIAEDYLEGNEDEGGYAIVDEDHIVVKAEYNDDFDDDIADTEQSGDYTHGYYNVNPGDGEATNMYPCLLESTDGGKWVQEMVEGTPDQQNLRKVARQENMRIRKDCPVCGDRVNGIHYGIFTCEGCKNFFKRSMSIKKPYVCSNRGMCDVGVYVDQSGIKRKGTRCQECRFRACLDSGMIHQGHNNRSSSRVRRPKTKEKTVSPTPAASKRAKLSNSFNENGLSESLKNSQTSDSKEGIMESEPSSILEQMLETPALEFKSRLQNTTAHVEATNTVINTAPIATLSTPVIPLKGQESEPFSQLEKDQFAATISLLRDQLHYERNKNSELQRQLYQREDQVNCLEKNLGKFEKHVFTSNNTVVKQKVEIARLQQEVKQLGIFRNLINSNKPQNNSNGGIAEFAHQQNGGFKSCENIAAAAENKDEEGGVDPLNFVSVQSLSEQDFIEIKEEC